MEQDETDFDENEFKSGIDEFRMLIFLFAGLVWRGASADEVIAHVAEHGESMAPGMAAQINPEAGPKASFFRIVGRALWNSLPQPEYDFRLRKLPEPGRNDPCFCGSLHKYKHCCARMPEFPVFPSMLLEGLLTSMPNKRWSDLAGSSIDRDTVLQLVYTWQDEGKHAEVSALLDPWFKGDGVIKNVDADLLDMLLESYVELEKPRKRKSLAKAAIARGENVVRSIGWQRISLMAAADDDYVAANKAMIEAQRADPENINIGLLEVQLLMSRGQATIAQERAKYWVMRLIKLKDPSLQEQIDWLREVILNPQQAMMKVVRKGDKDIAELEELMLDLPGIACHYHLQPLDNSTGPFIPDEKLGKALRGWRAVFPHNPPDMTQVTSWNEAAWDDAAPWLLVLKKQPVLWSSFEVLDDLVCALDGCGMNWVRVELVPPLLKRARLMFTLVLEKQQAHKLRCEWAWQENRPALRLLARMALDGLGSVISAERDDAFVLMHRFVTILNPNDNHGFRAMVLGGLLERGKAAEAIEIASRYPDDLADLQYTHALALHVAGHETEAQAVAVSAIKDYPKVARMLLADTPRKPRNADSGTYGLGSDEEAWLYREEFHALWKKMDALGWLKEQSRKKP